MRIAHLRYYQSNWRLGKAESPAWASHGVRYAGTLFRSQFLGPFDGPLMVDSPLLGTTGWVCEIQGG